MTPSWSHCLYMPRMAGGPWNDANKSSYTCSHAHVQQSSYYYIYDRWCRVVYLCNEPRRDFWISFWTSMLDLHHKRMAKKRDFALNNFKSNPWARIVIKKNNNKSGYACLARDDNFKPLHILQSPIHDFHGYVILLKGRHWNWMESWVI